jgi:aminopeptidase N
MKKPALILLAALLALSACGAPQDLSPDPFEVDFDDRSLFEPTLIEAERPVLEGLPGATVYHMDLTIADNLRRVEGREQIRYTNREGVDLDRVCLRLYPNVTGGAVTVSDLQVDGQATEPTYYAYDSALCAALPGALPPGASTVLDLAFQVDVPTDAGGNYGLFGVYEDVLVLDTFYPAVPVYDEAGWQIEAPAQNGDLTYYDASFYLVRVRAPRRLTIVASGSKVGRTVGGRRQAVTLAAGPARDFYLAASRRYVRESAQIGETTVHSYAFAGRRESAKQALKHAEAALRGFGARLGAYPYTEMDLASTPMSALGIEYPGTMGFNLQLYNPDAVVSGLPAPVLLESVVAHEVAHQWFYNAVGNDQQGEPWLDEAVVQYMTGLYYLDQYGPQGAESYRSSWTERWDRLDQAAIPIGRPAGAYTREEYSPIVYGRGPIFVRALEQEMGQPAFDAFLRDYYTAHKWGIGTPEAFREQAEAHCACDLGPLFEAWVYD